MILELADIRIYPGSQQEFELAIQRGMTDVIRHAKGFISYQVRHSIESPERYVLMIEWETLENHTVDFRGSEDFTAWRGLVGQYFAAPPEVEHTETVLAT